MQKKERNYLRIQGSGIMLLIIVVLGVLLNGYNEWSFFMWCITFVIFSVKLSMEIRLKKKFMLTIGELIIFIVNMLYNITAIGLN